MKEIGLLAVAHDEHEGLLTVGASERAHEVAGYRAGTRRARGQPWVPRASPGRASAIPEVGSKPSRP